MAAAFAGVAQLDPGLGMGQGRSEGIYLAGRAAISTDKIINFIPLFFHKLTVSRV